uniref:DUF6534 domain-containing protein n=1 Tax=Moniliophthora roreri TaxID=221103 RepID=A0A0W0F250_MONRR
MHLFYAARMYNVGDRRDRRIPPIVCILKVLQIGVWSEFLFSRWLKNQKNFIYFSIFEVVGNLYSNLFILNLRKIHAKALLPVSVEPSHLSFAMTGNLSSGIGSTHPVEVRFPEPPIQSSQSWSAKCAYTGLHAYKRGTTSETTTTDLCFEEFYSVRTLRPILAQDFTVVLRALETVHEILATHAIYHHLILNFGNPFALLIASWSAVATIPLTTLIEAIVHSFYAGRIYQLSRKRDWWTPAVVCILKTVQIALSIIITIDVFNIKSYIDIANNKRVTAMDISCFLCSLVGDILCAGTLSYYLHTSRSGINSTDSLINKLIIHTVNNGAVTSMAGICLFVFIVPKPKSLIYFAIFQVLSNLYANSLLSTLNSRRPHAEAPLSVVADSSNHSFGKLRPLNGSISTTATDHPVRIPEPLSDVYISGRNAESSWLKMGSGRG